MTVSIRSLRMCVQILWLGYWNGHGHAHAVAVVFFVAIVVVLADGVVLHPHDCLPLSLIVDAVVVMIVAQDGDNNNQQQQQQQLVADRDRAGKDTIHSTHNHSCNRY